MNRFLLILLLLFAKGSVSQVKFGETEKYLFLTRDNYFYISFRKYPETKKYQDSLVEFMGELIKRNLFDPKDILGNKKGAESFHKDAKGKKIYEPLESKKPHLVSEIEYVAWLTSSNAITDSIALEIRATEPSWGPTPCYYILIIKTKDGKKVPVKEILTKGYKFSFKRKECEI